MKTRFLIVPCLLAACSATPPGSPPTSVAFAPKTRVDVSKFQPGEDRDSIVNNIGEADWLTYQDDGDRCDVYNVAARKQGIFRYSPPRSPSMMMGYGQPGTYEVMGGPPFDQWPLAAVRSHVVLCYKNSKLVRLIADPCPSAACPTPSSPALRPPPAASVTGKPTQTSPNSQNQQPLR
jgi:hypothetical protein